MFVVVRHIARQHHLQLASAEDQHPIQHLTPQAAILLLVAAVAWLVTAGRAGTMVGMPGTLGLSLPALVGMWGLMMSAMCSPRSPGGLDVPRSVRSFRALRCPGHRRYLLAWAGLASRPLSSPRSWPGW